MTWFRCYFLDAQASQDRALGLTERSKQEVGVPGLRALGTSNLDSGEIPAYPACIVVFSHSVMSDSLQRQGL